MRMMAKTPEARYQTAAEVAQKLSGFMVMAHRGGSFPAEAPARRLCRNPEKELKVRGSGPSRGSSPKQRGPGSGSTGNTISNQDSETFKSPGKPTVRKSGSSVNKNLTKGELGTRPARRPPPGAGLTSVPSDSSEFVFDTPTLAAPAPVAPIVGMGSSKSIVDQRAERKRGSKAPVPWWIWAVVGGGLLLVCYLAYKVFSG